LTISRRLDAGGAGETQQFGQVRQRPRLLGQVEGQAGGLQRQPGQASGLSGEQAGDPAGAGAVGGGVQRGPCGVEFRQSINPLEACSANVRQRRQTAD
jgi:hypothetical protein